MVQASGLAVTAGTLLATSGALSVVNAAATATLDVYANNVGFTGNLLYTQVSTAGTNQNALRLYEGANLLFNVRAEVECAGSLYTFAPNPVLPCPACR